MKLSGGVVRGILEREDPHLHGVLLRQWEIALDHWLAALSLDKGSFHGYPHQRNVERHLDSLLSNTSTAQPTLRVRLSPAELYVLLSAILFHDIGRAFPGKRADDFDHGEASLRILKANWAALGLPSEQIAEAVGRVSAFHNLEGKKRRARIRELQQQYVIDAYGSINLQRVAALLFVADHLDSAFTRVQPTYLQPDRGFAAIGTFRKAVRGVRIDHDSQLICTVLGDIDIAWVSDPRYRFDIPPRGLKALGRAKLKKHFGPFTAEAYRKAGRELTESYVPRLEEGMVKRRGRIGLSGCGLVSACRADPEREGNGEVLKGPQSDNFTDLEWLVVCKKLFACATTADDFAWAPSMVIAMVLGDVRVNDGALRDVSEVMASMGMPFRAWLLEHDGRLYNAWGEQTCEPVLDRRYLESIAKGMWGLNKNVFGWSRFTYENLGDAVQEPDVPRVKRAVHRLCKVLESDEPAGPKLSIQADPDRWQFKTPEKNWRDLYLQEDGTDAGLNLLNQRINGLGVPVPRKPGGDAR